MPTIRAMQLTPMWDRVVIQVTDNSVTSGGVLLPGGMKMPQYRIGRVLRVGPGHIDAKGNPIPMRLKIGDNVCFSGGAGNEIDFGGGKVFIVSQEAVHGTLAEEDVEVPQDYLDQHPRIKRVDIQNM